MTTSEPASFSNEPSADPGSDAQGAAFFNAHRRTQVAVTIASAVCFVVFWFGAAWVGLPSQPGFQGSLLLQRAGMVMLAVTWLLMLISFILASLIAGRMWFFAGLFSALVGFGALSIRGGSMRYVLFEAASHNALHAAFVWLAVEQLLLFVPIALAWVWAFRLYEQATAAPETQPSDDEHPTPIAMILGAQLVITAVLMLLLVATENKKQVLIGTFIAGLAGTSIAEQFAPTRKAGAWLWVGPLVVGFVGYLLAASSAGSWTTGDPMGTFAALARPLPLDYASAGCAGALLGFWLGAERPDRAFSLRGRGATNSSNDGSPG